MTDMTKRAAGAKRADVTGHVVAYRIQRGAESLEPLLDPRRPDGWTCDEERVETQPLGVSACSSEDDLRAYIREYSLAVREGDRLVEYELLALDGRRSRSGMFATAWLPLAVATVLRHESGNALAREVWQQIVADADGDGRWLEPGVLHAR